MHSITGLTGTRMFLLYTSEEIKTQTAVLSRRIRGTEKGPDGSLGRRKQGDKGIASFLHGFFMRSTICPKSLDPFHIFLVTS